MKHEKIEYLRLIPYKYKLTDDEFMNKFLNSKLMKDADDKTKLTIKTCEVLLQDISSENSISNDIIQAFINQVRNEDEHLKDDEEESESTTSYDISEDQLHVYIVKAMCMNNEKQEAYGSQSSYHEFLLKVFKGIGAKWKLYKEEQEKEKDILNTSGKSGSSDASMILIEHDFELSILIAYIDTIWTKYDTDRNGSISVDETKQLLSDITGHKSISREECEQFVKSLDEQDKMKDHESDNKIEKEEFIFFVDDMMAMEADQRKGYAAKGAFYQTLIDFINGFENRYRDYENKKMELYKPFASHILDVYSNGNPKLTMETCTVLLQDMSSEKSISHDIVQSFINRVRNEDEHTDNDEKR